MHSYLPAVLRTGLFVLLLIISGAIIYATNANIRIVRTLAIQSLTDTAVSLSSAADNALQSMKWEASDIRAIFSDRIVAYAMVAEKNGMIRFHTNSQLIGARLSSPEVAQWLRAGTFKSRRITLGTGVPAYEFDFVMYRTDESPHLLRLVLNTTSADNMILRAERMWWIAGLLIALLWAAGIAFERIFTHRVRTQAARENQKRLTLIGQMTAVLAHEIRNALGSMKGYAQWLEEKAETGSAQKDAMAVIVKGALRIESLVQELLLYSKVETYRFESVEPALLIQEAVSASAAGWPGEIDLDVPAGVFVTADSEKLHRALVNGVRNALEAMGENGRLRIDMNESGRQVVVRIKDTGTGVLDKDMEKLFTPFYTTKTDGAGLGLAYTKKVVEGMDGTVRLENSFGGGAVLTIELPKAKVK